MRYLVMMLVLLGCKSYSFTGASISPDIKTITIAQFQNNASIVNPLLSPVISEKMRDKFLSQTTLKLVNTDGDVKISGFITGYNVTPVAFQGNQTNALNRLTITIKVQFQNKVNPKENWEQIFSNYSDFSAANNFTVVEPQLTDEITRQLVDNIFNKAFVNW